MAPGKQKRKPQLTGKHKPQSLMHLMKDQYPAATMALLRAVVKLAETLGAPTYLVGGSVRDLLLHRPNLDLDLVLEGGAIRLGRTLLKNYGGRLVTHKAFGTAVWWLPDDKNKLFHDLKVPARGRHRVRLPEFLDLISARRETYRYPAALPTVQFNGIREDQFRRDFSINTLAIRLDSPAGELLDPWGGFEDLQRRQLRTLHPLSFSDDPTRILRMLRLSGRLGFRIEAGTLKQLKRYLPILSRVSGKRIRTELELTLLEKSRAPILRKMQSLGVLRTIHTRLRISKTVLDSVGVQLQAKPSSQWELNDASPSDLGFLLWLMNFKPVDIESIANRLSIRAELREAAVAAAKIQGMKTKLADLPPSKVAESLEKIPPLAIYVVYLTNQKNKSGRVLQSYVTKWRHIHPRTDGNHLRSLGLKPGPGYKIILNLLKAAWLDGEVRTAKQEDILLRKLIDEQR